MMEKVVHLLKELIDMIDSKGGDRIVCLFLFHSGLVMMYHGNDYGKTVAETSLGALLFTLKADRQANGVKKNEAESNSRPV